jgi:selenocysteine lyase/cysteine desulfurase
MNIDQIRASFPALGNNKNFSERLVAITSNVEKRVHCLLIVCDGSAVFADNAGGSQVLECVVKRLSEYMTGSNVQMGEGEEREE